MPWIPKNPIIGGHKICINCGKNLPISSFHVHRISRNGYRPECKQCHNEKNREYYEKNKDKVLERTRKYSKTEYRKAYCRNYQKKHLKNLREENATRPRPKLCECCFKEPTKCGIVWDHDHDTGLFRGWICSRCNTILGMSKDSVETLKMIIKYLRKYGKK